MSRIRGIETKVNKIEILPPVKNKNESDDKDDVENELLEKIPKVAKYFDLHRKIGQGTFSSVYLASLKKEADQPHDSKSKRWFAVKHLVPTTHPTMIAHELRCLKELGGSNHVVKLEWCVRDLDNVVFIMHYLPHKKFSEYVCDMDTEELRAYMRALFQALRHVHKHGVIHRDVKPSNFLYDRKNKRYALVDFGLAQHMAPPAYPPPAHQSLKRPLRDVSGLPSAKRLASDMNGRAKLPLSRPLNTMTPPPAHCNPPSAARLPCACAGVGAVCSECEAWAPPRANRAGTQGFRPPEVLIKYTHQSTAVDMWAAGVMLASLLSGKYPFFRSTDTDMLALAEIITFLGTDALYRAAAGLGRRLVASHSRRGICLRRLCAHLRSCAPGGAARPACADCRLGVAACVCRPSPDLSAAFSATATVAGYPDSAFGLAARLLDPDPRTRITAADALGHPFIANIGADG